MNVGRVLRESGLQLGCAEGLLYIYTVFWGFLPTKECTSDSDGSDEDVAEAHVREPELRYAVFRLPCYRATPSSTARATSAS